MNTIRSSRLIANIILGIKSGITGALIGLMLHLGWGNLQELKFTIATGFVIGFFIGALNFMFSSSRMKKLPYSIVLLLRTIYYFIIIFLSIYGFLILYLKSNGLGSDALSNPKAFEEIERAYFLVNLNILYVLGIAVCISFIAQVKSFFGKDVLFNYLIGSYHKPTVEERIFMFLDLNDATTLAENLGPIEYSALLRDFFNDLDNAITHHKGHVFQYVGDEVVVIWTSKQGLKNNNCINSFFMAQDIIEKRKEYYLSTYQSVPSFKAAVHIGEVSITEIGVSKKEIAYHGDTINTTARICGSAHKVDSTFLISKDLNDRLPNIEKVIFNEIGEYAFKGKEKKIVLYSLGKIQ